LPPAVRVLLTAKLKAMNYYKYKVAFHFQKFPVIIVYVFVVNVPLSTFKKKSLGFPPKIIA